MHFDSAPKKRWRWLLPLALVPASFLVAGKLMNTSPPTNSAQTAPDEAPELRTRVYGQSVAQVYAAAQKVAAQQKTWFKSWRIVTRAQAFAGPQQSQLDVEVPVLFFTDDLKISISAADDMVADSTVATATKVNVESKSRVGQGDFGENRRHIAQFLAALDKEMGGGAIQS